MYLFTYLFYLIFVQMFFIAGWQLLLNVPRIFAAPILLPLASALSSCLMEGTGNRILRVRRLTDAACGHEQNSPANLLNLLVPISVQHIPSVQFISPHFCRQWDHLRP